jgi:3-oxoacyl-[acyl-carrier protein] reductase
VETGLKGRTVLIGGASKGIGKGLALAFAREGVNVALLARGRDALDEVAKQIRAETDVEVLVLQADLTDAASVDAAAAEMRAAPTFATLNILVNNAGLAMTRPDRQIFWPDEQWEELIDVKITGALRTIRAFVPMMARDGTGRVITIAGSSGTAVWQTALVHGITNSALVHMTGYLAKDLAQEHITANVIVPGLVGTEMRQEWIRKMAADQGKTEQACLADICRGVGIFMERWAEVEEVGDLAVFLASDRARYINGAKIPLDGGFSVNAR